MLRSKYVSQTRAVLHQLIALPLVMEAAPASTWLTKARPFGLLVGLTPTAGLWVQEGASPEGLGTLILLRGTAVMRVA